MQWRRRSGLSSRVELAHADATHFDPALLFGVPSFSRILFSYSLSMIPDWRRVLEVAINLLTPGGRLHIVDFGNQERLPDFARALLLRWLAVFEVTPRADLEEVLTLMANAAHSAIRFERPFRGYVQYAVLTSPKPNNA